MSSARPTGDPVGGAPEGGGRLTHLDSHGRARMVDVTAKAVTRRRAEARCTVLAAPEALAALAPPATDASGAWGDARAAGTYPAKLTAQLIPLCHPLLLDAIELRFDAGPGAVDVVAVAGVEERTGVEMEALTACALAGLSLVAALLPHDPQATLCDLTLWHKSGGRSGTWTRDPATGAVSHRPGPAPAGG